MIYLDNAATSWPKAPGVSEQMCYYLDQVGASINRGVYRAAQDAGMMTLHLREQLCALFRHPDPTHVVLTSGATEALNAAIKGFIRQGDHVLVSAMEHNAVMRPLVQCGAEFDRVPCDKEGSINLQAIVPLIRENTKLFVLAHASNVCGTVQDVTTIEKLCKPRGVALVLDAAQTAGHEAIDFTEAGLSAMAIPAHKGLCGPQGIGSLLLSPEFARQLTPLIAGGTGSMSDSEELPPYMPDRFESGTPNLPGIYGWSAALEYIEKKGTLHDQETAMTEYLLQGLRGLEHLRIVGKQDTKNRVGVVSLDFIRLDNAEVADRLEREYGILTRCGLHCAPSAHKTLGTFPKGTVRLSLGHSTTQEQIDAAIEAISAIAAQA